MANVSNSSRILTLQDAST